MGQHAEQAVMVEIAPGVLALQGENVGRSQLVDDPGFELAPQKSVNHRPTTALLSSSIDMRCPSLIAGCVNGGDGGALSSDALQVTRVLQRARARVA
jgi:hypothetical protein